jgi:hypothetical protein
VVADGVPALAAGRIDELLVTCAAPAEGLTAVPEPATY